MEAYIQSSSSLFNGFSFIYLVSLPTSIDVGPMLVCLFIAANVSISHTYISSTQQYCGFMMSPLIPFNLSHLPHLCLSLLQGFSLSFSFSLISSASHKNVSLSHTHASSLCCIYYKYVVWFTLQWVCIFSISPIICLLLIPISIVNRYSLWCHSYVNRNCLCLIINSSVHYG